MVRLSISNDLCSVRGNRNMQINCICYSKLTNTIKIVTYTLVKRWIYIVPMRLLAAWINLPRLFGRDQLLVMACMVCVICTINTCTELGLPHHTPYRFPLPPSPFTIALQDILDPGSMGGPITARNSRSGISMISRTYYFWHNKEGNLHLTVSRTHRNASFMKGFNSSCNLLFRGEIVEK